MYFKSFDYNSNPIKLTFFFKFISRFQYSMIWARSCENVSYVICEQQRCRSACESTQSDQHLCCSLFRQYDMHTCYIQSLWILTSRCSWAGWFESYLVKNLRRHIFAWCGSYVGRLIKFQWSGDACSVVIGNIKKHKLLSFKKKSLIMPHSNALSDDTLISLFMTYEPPLDKTNTMICATSKDSDQPGHPPSLIRVFAVRSMGNKGPNLSSCGQRRLWSDWADVQPDLSLRWAHMPFCLFCHEAAHM